MHPLEHKLALLRRRIRRLAALYGLSRVLAVVVAVVIVLGLIDYLIRFQDPGLRLMASLGALAVAAWAGYRHLYRALGTRLHDADLARRLEKRFPELGDRLASAVDFLRQPEGDPAAGSVALRRAVISQTTAQTEDVDFQAVTRRGPVIRAIAAAAAMVAMAVALVVLNPLACQIAVARLAYPLGNVAWPKSTHLALRQWVDRVARGQAFEIEVVDQFGAALPEDARVDYRFQNPDGSVAQESEPMRLVGGVLVARRDNVTRPFSYAVRGGDDTSMPWTDVELIEPPAVESLSLRLLPPEYTGRPAGSAERSFRALVGTRVELSARATKPLASAVLVWPGRRDVPCRLSDDGLTLAAGGADAPVVVEKSGNYSFKLIDREGIGGDSDARWEVRAVPDTPPSVTVEQPGATLFVTPEATVPVRVVAKDDLAIHTIALVASRSDRPQAAEIRVPLYAGPDRAPAQPAGPADGSPSAESRTVHYQWKLAELGLRPGVQVNFYAIAGDYLPQSGKSDSRRLAVVTPEELAERIAARQAVVLRELERVLAMQRENRKQVGALEIQLREVRRLTRLDLDHLRGAELNQRQVQQTLTNREEGVPVHILGLLADLASNKVDSPEVHRQMQGLLGEIDRLGREHLPLIGQQLTGAAKSAQVKLDEAAGPPADPKRSVEPPADLVPALVAAGTHQDQVIASLEQVLGNLARWEQHYRRFHREIGQLLREQEELARTTVELSRRTLTKDVKDLLPQESADLKVAAQQQLDRARRLDRLQQDMQQAIDPLRAGDPLAAETLADALARAQQLTIVGQMRAASDALEANRMGQAMDRQKLAVQGLQEVLDILANRREPEQARLVKRLRELETELAELARQQEGVCRAMDAAAADPQRRAALEEAARRQQSVYDETQRLARRLARLSADAAARCAGQAAGAMQQASTAAGQGRGPEAAQRADEARKGLGEAARLLNQQRRQAESQSAAEQVSRLQDELRLARQGQQKVLDETRQFDQVQQAQGRLTRDQAAAVRDLARQQGSLRDAMTGLADRLAGAEVFHAALGGVAGAMGRAAGLLDRRQTDAATQRAEQDAVARLDQLLAALEPEAPRPGASQPPGGDQATGQDSNAQRAALRSLAELKLVRLLQGGVNLRTGELEQAFGHVEPRTDEARRQYEDLSGEQGRLAELVLRLVEPAEPAPKAVMPEEDNPLGGIARQMRLVESLLAQNQSSQRTQEIEGRIVADLDQLIEQASSARAQGKPSPGKTPQVAQRHAVAQPKPGVKPDSKPGQPGSTQAKQGDGKPGTSESRRPDVQEILSGSKQRWGELPEHAREQMLQLPPEEFLPKYETLIEEYYKRLAEEKP